MKSASRLLVLAGMVVAAALPSAQAPARPATSAPPALGPSRQALLVLTDDWNATGGILQRFERSAPGAPWRPVGDAVPVVVGRNGVAWGRNVPATPAGAPIKREGDGRAPAGAFRLGTAFGQSRDRPANVRIPYLPLADAVECVDDVRSRHYNELVTKRQAGRVDWTSSEKMWAEPLYRLGVVVEYNTGQRQPSAGSCIFLHLWKGPQSTTAGCTAMAESSLAAIVAWLDPDRKPVLIQLPRDQYRRLKTRWKLP